MVESGKNGEIISSQNRPESTIHGPRLFVPRSDFLEVDERQTVEEFRTHLDTLKELDSEYAAIMDADPTIRTSLEVLFHHSKWTARHSVEVGYLAFIGGKYLGFNGDRLTDFVKGATLHDIGKLEISREILDKPARLDEAEEAEMQIHPSHSFAYLYNAENPRPGLIAFGHHSVQTQPYPFDALADDCAQQVTNMLGGLRESVKSIHGDTFEEEEYTPFASQQHVEQLYPALVEEWEVVTIADVVHALKSHRPYKGSFPDELVQELTKSYKSNLIDALLVAYHQIPTLHGENVRPQAEDPNQPPQTPS